MIDNTPTSWIIVHGPQGDFDAYLALPPGPRGPGLVLFQEIFGVNAYIRECADMLAKDGFVVLAPDVFWRRQRRVDLGYGSDDVRQGIAFKKAMQASDTQHDIVASVQALRSRPEVQGLKVGACGFCLGGRMAFEAAAWAGVDAAVAYYGGGIQDELDLLGQISCPLMFHYGGHDPSIPAAAVERVTQAVADTSARVHVYPGAGHAFASWARESFHPASAALAHARTLEFLATRLF